MDLVSRKLMKLLRLFFFWPGQISRLTYFLAYLVLWGSVIVSLMAVVIYSTGSLSLFSNEAQWQGFFLVLAVLYLVALYCDVLIRIKRLRDMDRSPWHVLWMGLISILGSVFSVVGGTIADSIVLLLYAVQFAAFLWLVFHPTRRMSDSVQAEIVDVFA